MSGKNVEEFKTQIGEALDSYKQSLMGNSDGGSEDQHADRNVDSKGRVHGVSERNKDYVLTWSCEVWCLSSLFGQSQVAQAGLKLTM